MRKSSSVLLLVLLKLGPSRNASRLISCETVACILPFTDRRCDNKVSHKKEPSKPTNIAAGVGHKMLFTDFDHHTNGR